MNFRMVWGSDDSERLPLQEGSVAIPGPESSGVRYERRGTGMVRRERSETGRVRFTPVANFTARITRDLLLESDAGPEREFVLEAQLGGQDYTFQISATEFSRMSWVLRYLGPQAIVYPGQLQHARAAIQALSTQVRHERISSQMGWTKQEGNWMYVHSTGAVGAAESPGDVQVRLPEVLENYGLTPPPASEDLAVTIRSSLSLLSVVPDRVGFPLLAAVFRAPLGRVDFSVFLAGRTGTFKSTLAGACQQHFGAAMDAHHLPANFASTANALEVLAFSAKDALLVVDDFVSSGMGRDRALHGVAERLFRGIGNHQGRGRMNGNHQMGGFLPPRALVLATGEEVPDGRSLRARMLIVEIELGEVNVAALSKLQEAGRHGQLAAAMSAYLRWMASRYDRLQEHLPERVRNLQLHYQMHRSDVHARLPKTLAELHSSWEIWLRFARDVGVMGEPEQKELEERCRSALAELAILQAPYQHVTDPALFFVARLRAALMSGRAHVADRRGRTPDSPEAWGWRREHARRHWLAQGKRIGWVVRNALFLDSTAAYQLVHQDTKGPGLSVSEQALRRRLHARGLIASIDSGRKMLLIRRTLEGRPREVLHVRASDFLS